jgi:hypothetical protein
VKSASVAACDFTGLPATRATERQTDQEKAKRWLAFLRKHREVLAAFDFFAVPTSRVINFFRRT